MKTEDEEFSKLTFEEIQELFNQLTDSLISPDMEDYIKLADLIKFVFNGLIDNNLVDDLCNAYVNNLRVGIMPFEEIPFELWGIEQGDLIITDQMTDLFLKSYNLVKEFDKKGTKKVKELKKLVGNIPAVRLLEFMILEMNDKEDKCFEMAIDNYEKYPFYPIFKLQLLLPYNEYLPKVQTNLMPDLHSLFYYRTMLHEIEFMNYILTLIRLIENEVNATKLEALLKAIYILEIPEKFKKEVISKIKGSKFMLVSLHFSPCEDEEEE
jgi:hypothetical protein